MFLNTVIKAWKVEGTKIYWNINTGKVEFFVMKWSKNTHKSVSNSNLIILNLSNNWREPIWAEFPKTNGNLVSQSLA